MVIMSIIKLEMIKSYTQYHVSFFLSPRLLYKSLQYFYGIYDIVYVWLMAAIFYCRWWLLHMSNTKINNRWKSRGKRIMEENRIGRRDGTG